MITNVRESTEGIIWKYLITQPSHNEVHVYYTIQHTSRLLRFFAEC